MYKNSLQEKYKQFLCFVLFLEITKQKKKKSKFYKI